MNSVAVTRHHDFFIIDDFLFASGLCVQIGAQAFLVYCYLVYRANQHDDVGLSNKTSITYFTGLSDRAAGKAVEKLIEYGLVRRLDNGDRYLLQIVDKSEIQTPAH